VDDLVESSVELVLSIFLFKICSPNMFFNHPISSIEPFPILIFNLGRPPIGVFIVSLSRRFQFLNCEVRALRRLLSSSLLSTLLDAISCHKELKNSSSPRSPSQALISIDFLLKKYLLQKLI